MYVVFLHGGPQIITTGSLTCVCGLFAWGTSDYNKKIFKFNSDLFARGSSVCNNKIFKFNMCM